MEYAPSAPVNSRMTLQQGVVWVLFLFSGICGLIYEVLWCRHLGLLFGNTVQSMSTVLTAFMAGLALGSYVGGRVSHRLKRPMMVYGILELAIGIYCAFLPWAFGAQSPILPFYRSLYGEAGGGMGLSVARFAISFFLLLIPTTFMGATLPVLAQFLVRSKAFLGRTVGALYAVNTFGAVLGAALTGFVLLPMLGKSNSNSIAVVANLVLGTLAVIFGMRDSSAMNKIPEMNDTQNADKPDAHVSESGGSGPQAPVSPRALRLAIITFGITGFAAMATQIGWTRAIILATGSSTYAFSLIVGVFIMGLSLGGMWGARAASRTSDPLALLGKLLLAIGLGCMALTAILEFGPRIFLFLIVWGSDAGWTWRLVFQALGISALIIGPTFLMGATMPLTMQVAARTEGAPGRTVGTIYAVNTVGSILGSFLGGLVLLPHLRIQGTLQLMALLYAAPGLVLYFMSKSGREKKPRSDFLIVLLAAATALGVLAYSIARPWDRLTMSSGMYLLRKEKLNEAVRQGRWADAFFANLSKGNRILYYNEGAAATVSVNEVDHDDGTAAELSLTVGGKPDASSKGDMSTQLGLTLVPVLLHEKGPEAVLVIGLGSGASAYAALTPDSVKSVDVVEMSPEVVEASYYFADYTHLHYSEQPGSKGKFWLDTPRLNLILNDGRNHLLLTSKKYDVIASEPSNPWLAGVGNLFTRESFQLCRDHLNPRGIMCQWIHCYSLEEDDFFSIVKTFADVFPHIQLWCVNRFDFLLIGSDDAVRLPFATLSKRMHQEKVWTLLQQIHFDTEEEFLACFMSADSELRAKSKPARLHTDDNMLLEFSAPKALPNPKQQLRSTEFEADPEFVADLAHTTFDERSSIEARLDVAAAARAHTRCAFDRMGSKFEADHWLAARVLAPHQLWVAGIKREIDFAALSKLANAPPAPAQPSYVTRAFELAGAGEIDKAIAELEAAAVKLAAEGKPVFECIEAAVDILRRNGQLKDAMTTLDGVLQNGNMRENPLAAKLWAAKAGMLQDSAPKSSNAEEQGQIALAVARLAQTLAAKDAGGHDVVGRVLLKQKKFGQAFDEFHALCMNKADNSDFLLGLADALTGMGIDPMGSQSNPDAALKKLRYARRAAREVATLRDDPAAWARLAEIQLLLAFQDKPSAAYHSREALKAWHKVVELDKAGVLRKIGPDVLTAEDLKKARLDATLWQIGDTYKMEVNDFLKLHSTLSNLTAQ